MFCTVCDKCFSAMHSFYCILRLLYVERSVCFLSYKCFFMFTEWNDDDDDDDDYQLVYRCVIYSSWCISRRQLRYSQIPLDPSRTKMCKRNWSKSRTTQFGWPRLTLTIIIAVIQWMTWPIAKLCRRNATVTALPFVQSYLFVPRGLRRVFF